MKNNGTYCITKSMLCMIAYDSWLTQESTREILRSRYGPSYSWLGSHGVCPRLKMVSRGLTLEGNLNRGARLWTICYRGQLPVTRLYIASLIDPPYIRLSLSFSPLSLSHSFTVLLPSSIAFISPPCSPTDRVLCVSGRREHGKLSNDHAGAILTIFPSLSLARCPLIPCSSFSNSQVVLSFAAKRHYLVIQSNIVHDWISSRARSVLVMRRNVIERKDLSKYSLSINA